MAKKKITIKTVKALKKSEIIWDTEVTGFGCRYRVDGKYFMLKYSINKRQRFYTIGQFGNGFTPDQARQEAEKLKGQIRQGIDPMAEKEAVKKIPTLNLAFSEYLEEVRKKRSPRTHQSYANIYEKIIKPDLGGYKVEAVTRPDVARLHNKLKDTPYQANRTLALLSSFFSWCNKHGHRTDGANPCQYIEKYPEKARERFLSEDELFRLGVAISEYEKNKGFKDIKPYVTTAIRLLILTGARCNEILTLQWKDIDIKRRLIRLQESKTGQKTIYLSAPALQLLSDAPRIEGNPYVICGKNEGAHLVNIKDPWREIRKNAELEDVRIHDLRHNYASTAVTTGHHLKVIGTLLGHTNTKTTERYAHLANDPLQAANEDIGQKILNVMSEKTDKNNIVKIHNK